MTHIVTDVYNFKLYNFSYQLSVHHSDTGVIARVVFLVSARAWKNKYGIQ